MSFWSNRLIGAGILFTTILIVLLASLSARAEPAEVKFQLIPPGEEFILGEKGKARCYFLEEWIQLAEADHELHTLRRDNQDLKDIIVALRDKGDSLKSINQSLVDDRNMIEVRARSLEIRVKDCQSQLDSCGDCSWPWAAAILGATVGAVGVSFVVGHWLSS